MKISDQKYTRVGMPFFEIAQIASCSVERWLAVFASPQIIVLGPKKMRFFRPRELKNNFNNFVWQIHFVLGILNKKGLI